MILVPLRRVEVMIRFLSLLTFIFICAGLVSAKPFGDSSQFLTIWVYDASGIAACGYDANAKSWRRSHVSVRWLPQACLDEESL
jgi:hypothetical protein